LVRTKRKSCGPLGAPLADGFAVIKEVSFRPITEDNVCEVYEYLFAPWVRAMGLTDIRVGNGQATAILPQNDAIQWANGAICGQAIMSAVDTVVSLAMHTRNKPSKGTASQNTQFLRRAAGDDLRIEAQVLKFGSTIAYAEARVTFATNGELVAHSTAEFVF
jgi:acyl-coenzyme A thioesterase PaaI-like protein